VPNHTSDQHPWFVESRASRDSPKRSWYRWRDGTPDRPPNNWPAAFGGGPAWTWDAASEQWYLHTFLPQQPDLNWDEPAVVEAMHDVLRFWMDRGVDGFRADVVHLIGKDPALADVTTSDIVSYHDYTGTHALLRGIRRVLDEYPDRMIVGEVNLRQTTLIAPYLGDDDELHLAFDFESLDVPWDAEAWRARIAHVEAIMGPRWPTWVFSNHDQPRIRTRLNGSDPCARAAALMLLTLRGTPFLYAGEELGLEDAEVPVERVVDPGGRDGCRAPLPWTAGDGYGWPADPWLPWPPDPAARSVEAQRADPDSMLHLCRAALALRRASPALRLGTLELLDDVPDGVLAYERAHGDDRRLVWLSFGDEPVPPPPGWVADLAAPGAAVLRPT
jgi:alpha-glucosidase